MVAPTKRKFHTQKNRFLYERTGFLIFIYLKSSQIFFELFNGSGQNIIKSTIPAKINAVADEAKL